VTRALARGARRAVLTRILDPADVAPRLRGRTTLRDAEGGGRRELFADGALEQAAHARIADHFRRLGEGLLRLGAPLHELAVAEPFEEAFLAMLRRSAMAGDRVA
jgi:hypothetical protein